MTIVELIVFSTVLWLIVLVVSWVTVGLPSSLLLSYLLTVGSVGMFIEAMHCISLLSNWLRGPK